MPRGRFFAIPRGMKRVISTDKAPAAIGPYSQAIAVSPTELVFCSGQIALDPGTGQIIDGDVAAQTERVLANIEAVLAAAGCSFGDVVKTTIFLADMGDFAKVNELYAKRFPTDPPARSTVQAARLPRDVKVEIEVIAAKR
jgi:2-iminobutanoate/2-iminopropanoate deaminase